MRVAPIDLDHYDHPSQIPSDFPLPTNSEHDMLGPLANGIALVFEIILQMIQLLVLASVIISWVGADPNNQLVRMIHATTEPIFRPVRKLTRNLPGPIDWAPLIVILIVIFLSQGIVPYIRLLGTP